MKALVESNRSQYKSVTIYIYN